MYLYGAIMQSIKIITMKPGKKSQYLFKEALKIIVPELVKNNRPFLYMDKEFTFGRVSIKDCTEEDSTILISVDTGESIRCNNIEELRKNLKK